MEGSLVAYKVFTNGSTLQASELNENLMQQAVATFSNAAARTAAITSPVEGQLTWLEDVNRYEFYDGSAWSSAANGTGSGLVHLGTTSASSASSVIFNNVFSSTYDTYRIIINLVSTGGNLQFRLRASGTDAAANYLNSHIYAPFTGAESVVVSNNTTFGATFIYLNSSSGQTVLDVVDPFTARDTKLNGVWASQFNGGVHASRHTATTSYDGFTLLPSSGTITGNIGVFGYKK
jgi:hypothetical protein